MDGPVKHCGASMKSGVEIPKPTKCQVGVAAFL